MNNTLNINMLTFRYYYSAPKQFHLCNNNYSRSPNTDFQSSDYATGDSHEYKQDAISQLATQLRENG